MKVQEMRTDALIPYPNNPRQNEGAVDAVANSIREFGFKVPIVVDRNNVIVAGHTRLKAAQKLGLETVPVVVADDLTDEQARAFRLADNKTAELAEWDEEKLFEELDGINLDMSEFGFDEIVPEGAVVEVDVPEIDPDEVPQTKIGDLYKLGDHFLLCGDCTSPEDIWTLMGASGTEERAALVLTDPPYNMNYEGAGRTPAGKRKTNKIVNDHLTEEEFERFLEGVYRTMFSAMKDGAACYVFYKELGKGVFLQKMAGGGITFKQELIWVKNQLVLGGSDYQNIYEPCLYGCKGKNANTWNGKRKQRSVIEQIDLMNELELRQALRDALEAEETDVVRADKQKVNDLHPTMKPIKLLEKFVRNSSDKGDVVLDLFGGSGSTLMTCEQLGRRCYTMEIEPRFCDVIVKRWEGFTGKKAELLKGDQNV